MSGLHPHSFTTRMQSRMLLLFTTSFLFPIAHFKVLIALVVHIKELCKPFCIRGMNELLERGKNGYIWHPGLPFAGAVAFQALLYLNREKVADDLGIVKMAQVDEFFAIFYGRVGVINHYRKSLLQRLLDQLPLPRSE